MARPLRIEKPGGWYHVSVRGNERKSIFRDDRDRRHFLEVLAEMVARFRFRLHGYVLMNNRLLNIPILAAGELSVQFSRLRTSVVRGG
jgi:REP element-mobilizing transposase RayT